MKTRRMIAKIIDALILLFFGFIITTFILSLILIVMGLILGINYESLLSGFMNLETIEEYEQFLVDYSREIFIFSLTFSIIYIYNLFIYYGIIGWFLNGSIGKLLLGLEVVKKNKNPNVFYMFIREPLVHLAVLNLISLIFSEISGIRINLFQYATFIYLMLFLFNIDFWANKFGKVEYINKN